MTKNAHPMLEQLVHDVIVPDVRELKARVASLENQMNVRFDAIEQRLAAMEQKNEVQFKALMLAIRSLRLRLN